VSRGATRPTRRVGVSMGWFSNTRQRQVLRLEPSRGVSAIGAFLVFLFAGAIATAAIAWVADAWPSDIRQPDLAGISDRTMLIVAAVAGTLSVLGLCSGVYDFSRWRLSRRVIRASNTPALRNVMPKHETVVAAEQAVSPPPLNVDVRTPRQFPKTPTPLRRVSTEANVIGHSPINIVYLRLFDNQPRARTFLESAWREFGYVFLLRSATSVTRREFTRARQLQSLDEMFVHDDETFGATLRLAPTSPMKKGRVVLPDVAPTRVRVRDPHGSYPVRAVLCHGDYWRRAVDILLGQVHLVVLDLSGFTERNEATAYELQRTIDLVPIERVMLLCDPQSSRRFLRKAVEHAWSQMSVDSPNATGGPRTATIAVTDSIRRHRTQQGSQEVEHVRLESSRRKSRRVAASAQIVAEAALHERRRATDTR
jgi:F0F1-type ATP synthase membrane subunit c/vacuolar-type H+-ATPase subunit K